MKNNFLKATTDFSTGAGKDICFLDDHTIQFRIPINEALGTHQNPKGYDYYFHISIENISKDSIMVNLAALRFSTIPDSETWHPSQAPVFCCSDGDSCGI